ncbi:hypothetical protein [Trichodesmium erythraeum]|uniref:hypothetical protein n=1 Tax=Trichodesmium erythraeum TaxID=1206 RepID=UPI00003C9EC3
MVQPLWSIYLKIAVNIVRLDGENDAEIKKQFNIARANNKELFSVDDFNNGDIKALPASTY